MKNLERDDPFELVGAGYRVTDAEATDWETARCIVEDYALTGFSASEILGLFESPHYVYCHAIYRRRGPEFVRAVVAEVFGGSR